MDGDPTPALTGRRRTRPPSIGCRNPQQPEPGRAPLISAKPAVQSNRATSPVSCQRRRLSSKIDNLPRWRAQQFFRTKPPPYLASGTLHEQRYPHCRSVVSDEFSSPSEPNFRLFCEERLTSHERKPRISAVRFE